MLKENISLLRYTSWKVGGKAKKYYCPNSVEELIDILKNTFDETITWLGLGSNVLISDDGIDGVLIHTHKGLEQISFSSGNIIVDAGVPCAKLAKFAIKNDFPDGAFFAGIPGTIGGALYMNAGAFGFETWDYVKKVTTIDKSGVLRTRTQQDYEISYRKVVGPNEWFVSAELNFKENKKLNGMSMIKELLKKRALTQPIGLFSCGSVFKNPKGHHAAKLIEDAGLKGYRIGGAHVSSKHANFIINDKNASSKEIDSLVEYIINIVKLKYNIQLETEFKRLGGA